MTPKIKTYKALAKRMLITKRGKILKRPCGQDHFNARESSVTTRNKRRDSAMDQKSFSRNIKRLLPYS